MPRKKHAEIYGGDRFREYEARLEERLAQAEQRLSRGKNKHMHYAEYRAFKQALDDFHDVFPEYYMRWTTTSIKPMAELTPGDIPRGIDPDRLATDLQGKVY